MTELEFMNEIAEGLQEVSKRRGISQRELSRRTGIDGSIINRYFNGKIMPSLKNLHNICYALKCDMYDIVMILDKVE